MLVACPLSKNLQKRSLEEHVKPSLPCMEAVSPVVIEKMTEQSSVLLKSLFNIRKESTKFKIAHQR